MKASKVEPKFIIVEMVTTTTRIQRKKAKFISDARVITRADAQVELCAVVI